MLAVSLTIIGLAGLFFGLWLAWPPLALIAMALVVLRCAALVDRPRAAERPTGGAQ